MALVAVVCIMSCPRHLRRCFQASFISRRDDQARPSSTGGSRAGGRSELMTALALYPKLLWRCQSVRRDADVIVIPM